MGARECAIQKKILDRLKKIQFSNWLKVISANDNGWPDIIGHINGKFVGIEVKTEKGTLQEIQRYRIDQINKSGAIVIVARSWSDVEGRLREAGFTIT